MSQEWRKGDSEKTYMSLFFKIYGILPLFFKIRLSYQISFRVKKLKNFYIPLYYLIEERAIKENSSGGKKMGEREEIEYEDFRVTITAKVKEGNRVLIESPAGGFAATFINPINKEEFDRKLMESGLKVRLLDDARSAEGLQEIRRVEITDAIDNIGNQLSKALFEDQVLGAYAGSKSIVDGKGHGLRVRIRVDPNIDAYAELMSLPWEFLYDEAKRSRIELMDNRAVVRDPITSTPATPLEVVPPLKVLAVVSDPDDYPSLKLGREAAFLARMSQQVPGIEVKFLETATIGALNDEMRRQESGQEYHILHFMGHGGFDSRSGKCVLIFKGDDNKGIPIDGEALKLALTPSVRLVFLNACETARIPEADPFAAIPTELLLGGITAVLSMQFPISDSAAIKFCETFYKCLAEGRPVDQCIGMGRKQIFFGVDTKSEWGTPVLFMRSTDGMLFKIKEESQQKGRKVVVAEK